MSVSPNIRLIANLLLYEFVFSKIEQLYLFFVSYTCISLTVPWSCQLSVHLICVHTCSYLPSLLVSQSAHLTSIRLLCLIITIMICSSVFVFMSISFSVSTLLRYVCVSQVQEQQHQKNCYLKNCIFCASLHRPKSRQMIKGRFINKSWRNSFTRKLE